VLPCLCATSRDDTDDIDGTYTYGSGAARRRQGDSGSQSACRVGTLHANSNLKHGALPL
jgi:hypothetical protein